MNWQEPRRLALALRDQGLCDCIAARSNLRADNYRVLGRATNLAHLVVAKCQQSVEKIMKGYLLWHSGNFDPTKGHTPFTNALAAEPGPAREITALCTALNRHNHRRVAELKWLESMAPHPPLLNEDEKGLLVALQKIEVNSEYAFWDHAANNLVIAAEGLHMRVHGQRAATALLAFLQVLSRSEPEPYTKEILEFLEDHPFSTAIVAEGSED